MPSGVIRSLILTLTATLVAAAPALSAPDDYLPPKIVQDDPVSVGRLVDLAAENRAAYRQALADEDIIPELKLGAVGQFLPSVNAGGGWSNSDSKQEAIYVEGIPVSQGGTFLSSSSNWYIQASETLFDGLGRFHSYQQAKIQVENTLLNSQRAHDLLVSDVKTAVYNYLAAIRALDVEREILQQRQEVMRLARARYETGDVIEIDVMQSEIDVNAQENSILTAEQAVENAREQLNLAVGLDLESRFPVEGDLSPVMPDVEPDSLVSIAMQKRPDLTITRNQVEYNKLSVKKWNSEYMPSANAYVTYSRSESQPDLWEWTAMPSDRNVRYGLNLNWTLFDRFSREVQREQAVVNKRKAMWDEHQSEMQVAADVRRLWRTLNALNEQIVVADRNRDLARRQLNLEQERYRVGVSDQLNLRSAQVTFVSAEREYLSRVLDFFTTMATLERDLGVPLEEVAR